MTQPVPIDETLPTPPAGDEIKFVRETDRSTFADPATFGAMDAAEDVVLTPLPDGRMLASTRDEYVERLERAVLGMWHYDGFLCLVCSAHLPEYNGHADDCLIPSLAAKYAE